MMKRCPRCGIAKALTEFNKNRGRRDGVHSICRECRKTYEHERYERAQGRRMPIRTQRSERGRTAWLRSLKEGKPCTDCGRVFPHQVLQWDHRPGFEKLGDISADFWGRSREEVLTEIAKCDLVCANCHAIRTFTRSGWALRWLEEACLMYDANSGSAA
jgi:hypothetical protein